jgi:hypothetical protein
VNAVSQTFRGAVAFGGQIYYECYVSPHDELPAQAPAYWIRRPLPDGPQFSFVLSHCRLHLQEPPFVLIGSIDSKHNRRTLEPELLRKLDPDGDGQATLLLWPDYLYSQLEALLPDALSRLAYRDYITRLARSKPTFQALEDLRLNLPTRAPRPMNPKRAISPTDFERGETFPLYAVLTKTDGEKYLVETFEMHLDSLQATLRRLEDEGRTVLVLSCAAEVSDFAAVELNDARGG